MEWVGQFAAAIILTESEGGILAIIGTLFYLGLPVIAALLVSKISRMPSYAKRLRHILLVAFLGMLGAFGMIVIFGADTAEDTSFGAAMITAAVICFFVGAAALIGIVHGWFVTVRKSTPDSNIADKGDDLITEKLSDGTQGKSGSAEEVKGWNMDSETPKPSTKPKED